MSNTGNHKRVYLDYASTTPTDERVFKDMKPFMSERFGNPDSIHKEGVVAKEALRNARATVARFFGAKPYEIVFTSSGTEANNLAIFGITAGVTDNPRLMIRHTKLHAITTRIEHSSVLEAFRELERRGVVVTYLPVKADGIIDLAEFRKSLRPETFLVSIGYANNEIGAVQPIRKISSILNECADKSYFTISNSLRKISRPVFHIDACQAASYLPLKVESLGADLVSIDGSKSYGPKGIGALYVRRGASLAPIIFGGGQEFGFRSGTVPVYLAVGLARALEICEAIRERESKRLRKLRDFLYSQILENLRIDGVGRKVVTNGSMKERLPNNLNISLPDIDTELLTLKLDTSGFAVSTKSACLADERISYVVKALGRSDEEAASTLRITLGRFTALSDVKSFAETLRRCLK